MKNILGFIRYHSCIIFPTLFAIMAYIFNQKFNYINIDDSDKITSLASLDGSLIGVLITILTIYLAVPKNEFIKKRLKDSKHERIYLYNLLGGIIVWFASILSWIFFDNVSLLVILFIAGTSNIAISIYYTFTLIKLI